MANTNPARGMRDFLPSDVRKRNYVIGIIKKVYESYGFEPLETPSVENLETLTGKYGEEGNQLIFKILERGEKIQKKLAEGAIKNENELSDLALRYDLTVPLARVVANYKNDLPKFFKRYQIQPVWRADRPARGRYREFYQCDVDAIGSKSMIVEAELISAVCEILEKLGFKDYEVRVNHRKVLKGILESAGVSEEKQTDALVALDKIDKIGREGVEKEFKAKGITDESSTKLLTFFEYFIKDVSSKNFTEAQKFKLLEIPKLISSTDKLFKEVSVEMEKRSKEFPKLKSVSEKQSKAGECFMKNGYLLGAISAFIGKHPIGQDGYRDLRFLNMTVFESETDLNIKFDPTLARGLSYYTGAIFEIVLTNGDFAGSIGGGGRYDGLIGMFGKEEIPACGFSLGLERILVVMEERGMFPPELQQNSADVMVTIWNEESVGESLKLANELRSEGLRVLVYPEADKLGKQFKYAGQINVPFVCILGENELAENKVAVKNMVTGEQEVVDRAAVSGKVKSNK